MLDFEIWVVFGSEFDKWTQELNAWIAVSMNMLLFSILGDFERENKGVNPQKFNNKFCKKKDDTSHITLNLLLNWAVEVF